MDFHYRWAEPEDVPRIKEFISEHFGPDSIQAATGRFEALFTEHPCGFHVALCGAAGKIAGLRCYLPARIVCNRQEYQAAFPVDLMVGPEFRRMGISSYFLDMALERFQVTISSGQSTAQAALYGKRNAVVVASYHKGYLVRRPRLGNGIKTSAREILSWFRWVGLRKLQTGVFDLHADGVDGIRDILADRFGEGEAGVGATSDLLIWRYAGSFYRDCRLALLECGEDRGIVAYRVRNNETQILDIFCRAESLQRLIRGAAAGLAGARLTAVFAGSRLAGRFADAGFLVRPQEAKLTVYTRDPVLGEVLQRADWNVFAGDSDTALLEFPEERDPGEIF